MKRSRWATVSNPLGIFLIFKTRRLGIPSVIDAIFPFVRGTVASRLALSKTDDIDYRDPCTRYVRSTSMEYR
jgi:hypothetical protein